MSAIEFTPDELDVRFARAKHLRPSAEAPLTGEAIANEIAKKYGVTLDELRTRRRFKHLTDARKEIYRALLDLGWTTAAVGEFVGVDHSTVHKVLKYQPRGGK